MVVVVYHLAIATITSPRWGRKGSQINTKTHTKTFLSGFLLLSRTRFSYNGCGFFLSPSSFNVSLAQKLVHGARGSRSI